MGLLVVLTVILWASSVLAQPFLVSDPTSEPVAEYVVTLDGVETISPAQDLGNGMVKLHHDMAGITDGPHTMEVKARNIWGDSLPAPFAFTKTLPLVPVGIGLER